MMDRNKGARAGQKGYNGQLHYFTKEIMDRKDEDVILRYEPNDDSEDFSIYDKDDKIIETIQVKSGSESYSLRHMEQQFLTKEEFVKLLVEGELKFRIICNKILDKTFDVEDALKKHEKPPKRKSDKKPTPEEIEKKKSFHKHYIELYSKDKIRWKYIFRKILTDYTKYDKNIFGCLIDRIKDYMKGKSGSISNKNMLIISYYLLFYFQNNILYDKTTEKYKDITPKEFYEYLDKEIDAFIQSDKNCLKVILEKLNISMMSETKVQISEEELCILIHIIIDETETEISTRLLKRLDLKHLLSILLVLRDKEMFKETILNDILINLHIICSLELEDKDEDSAKKYMSSIHNLCKKKTLKNANILNFLIYEKLGHEEKLYIQEVKRLMTEKYN